MLLWSTWVAGIQATVEWQASQLSVDKIWELPLPVAVVPLWQVLQGCVTPA